MSKIIEIAKHQLRLTFQSKSALLTTFIMPILFTICFSSTSSSINEYMLYMNDLDQSSYSSKLIEMVDNTEAYKVVQSSQEEIEAAVYDRKTEVGFIIPEGFGKCLEAGESPQIKVIRMKNTSEAGTVQSIVSKIERLQSSASVAGTAADMLRSSQNISETELKQWFDKVYAEAEKGWEKTKVKSDFKYAESEADTFEYDASTQSSAGYLAFFLNFTIVFGIGALLQEKERGTLKKLLVSPTSKNEILLGKFLGTFILGLIQMFVLVLFGAFMLKVKWFTDPVSVTLLLLAYLFSLIGVGSLLVGVVRTFSQLNSIGSLAIVSMGMIGGTWWPLEISPKWIQFIAKFTPQGWFMMGITEIVQQGKNFSELGYTFAALLAIGGICLIVSLKFADLKKLAELS